MINIYFSGTTRTPLYQQIIEQIKQLVAANSLKPGEHLPAVRQLAHQLHINPGTVSRAYSELERQEVVMSRHGGGTIVSTAADNPRILMLRQKHLSDMVSNNILDILSLGYTLEELETALPIHLTRWRQERQNAEKTTNPNTISIVGSDDLALSLLINRLMQKHPQIFTQFSRAGSLGGLIALQRGEADLAGIHLLDEETGKYNHPYVKHILPGIRVAVVHLACRAQGFILPKGNPQYIRELKDLTRPEITMVNRQKGSGTRVLLDMKLRELGIQPDEIKGYYNEEDTHLAVVTAIADGRANVGLGIKAAAGSSKVDFIPLLRERYDLVMTAEKYKSKPLSYLVDMVKSRGFKKSVLEIGGYDTKETGKVNFIE
jgi:molybdate-binding protein/DNA-binding transcriptional regulator YhcF (GntR family)